MIASTEARRLAAYEEDVGDLTELVMKDGILFALIGKVLLALPANYGTKSSTAHRAKDGDFKNRFATERVPLSCSY